MHYLRVPDNLPPRAEVSHHRNIPELTLCPAEFSEKKITFAFSSFRDIDWDVLVVGIFPHGKYRDQFILHSQYHGCMLMTWRCKEPGHHQQLYCSLFSWNRPVSAAERINMLTHRTRITATADDLAHYGVGSWSLYTKQATPGSPPLLCRGHPTQSATSTMEPQGFQWALTQWRRSPVKVTRSPWDYFLKTQNGWQPTCVDMQNNVENVFVECTIYFLTIMQLTEAGLSIWQVQ